MPDPYPQGTFDRELVFVCALFLRAGRIECSAPRVISPIAGATQRVWSSFLEDIDSLAAVRLLQLALERAVEEFLSLGRKSICGAAIAPSLERALTSEGQPSHPITREILAPSFSASVSPRSMSVPWAPLPTYRARGAPRD